MKSLLKYTLSLFVFWLFVFFINRLFFVLYQLPIGHKIQDKADLYKAFYKGYAIDFATVVIFILLPILFSCLYFIFHKKGFVTTIRFLIGLFLFLFAATSLADAGLYKEWNAKINLQALAHFKNPKEVLETVSLKLEILFLILMSLFTFPFYFLYKKFIEPTLITTNTFIPKKRVTYGIIYFLLSVGIGVIIIRGGVTGIPQNQSVAYFSKDVMANDIAVNPLYNILQDLTIQKNIPPESVYKLRSNEEAQELIRNDFFVKKDTTIKILNTEKPNIIILFLESWSADNISLLGGIEGCTPQFNKLSKEGLLFTKTYSEAYVSDQGIPAVLSAAPSVSRVAIVNQPAKVPAMECLSQDLLPLGYSSSFMFGGDLVYGNLRGYLLEKKFSELKEEFDYPQFPKGKLGIHDEFMFPELLRNVNAKKEPFLQCFFTSSTHMPYDYPSKINWHTVSNDVAKEYTESIYYSDNQMGLFFEETKKMPWYKNTLFVVVADHTHNTIKQHDPLDPEQHHIPLLMLGGALKEEWKGKTWNKIVSQLDIASTLLHQLNIPAEKYVWSRNMLNPYTTSSAYYVMYGGCGYICDTGFAANSQQTLDNIFHPDNMDSLLMRKLQAKAMSFQQLIYEEKTPK